MRPRSRLGDSLLVISSQAAFWATYVLRAAVMNVTYMSALNDESEGILQVGIKDEFPFCVIVGGGQLGGMVAHQLLDLGWPAHLIELATSGEIQGHVKTLLAFGLRCSSKDACKESLSRAAVVILTIRPSNLEYFARYAAENLAKNVLVVSCLAAIPATKIKASLNVNFVIQTTVAIERLPLSHRGVGAALYHIAHNKDDANESLTVISNMFQKMHMSDCVIPKSIDSAADFMSIIVSRLLGDLKSLFFHLIPEPERGQLRMPG